MALMYPDIINIEETKSEAEIFVFNKLKEDLDSRWTVFHSVKWVGNEFVGQSQGECDFILINKDYGILIIEVKGGKVTSANGKWYSLNRENYKNEISNPQNEADKSKFIILNKLKNERVKSYVTTAVWFPDTDIKKSYLPLDMPKEIILDVNSSENIEENLINIFKYRMKNESFIPYKIMDSDYKKIINCIMPNVCGKEILKKKCEDLKMKYLKLNEEQALCFSQLEDNKLISVKGHAGTGKTVLAMHKAFEDSKKGKKVLYLCYNVLLSEKIKEESLEEFQVFSIYGFAENYLKVFDEKKYNEFQETGDYDEMISRYLEIVKDNTKMKFDTILIDEAQDFKKEWIDSINYILNEEGSLCIFYDEAQMLYEKYGIKDISYLKVGTKYTLKRNMRNTDEICLSSLNIAGIDKNNVILSGINGLKPKVIYADNSLEIEEKIKDIVSNLKNIEKIQDDNITFLILEAKKKLIYKKKIKKYSKATVESIRRYKGLENDIIIIPDLNSDFLKDEEVKKLLYVAISRARCEVILIINIETLSRKQASHFKRELNEYF